MSAPRSAPDGATLDPPPCAACGGTGLFQVGMSRDLCGDCHGTAAPTWRPGDLDRLHWAVAEAAIIDTSGVIEHSGVPFNRARAALGELERQGRVTKSDGHHHNMDGDLCQCTKGEAANLPRLTHWHTHRGDPS